MRPVYKACLTIGAIASIAMGWLLSPRVEAAKAPPPVIGIVELWGDYSMMDHRRAGQLWSDGVAVSQFAWSPQPNGESHVFWGDPAAWPPDSAEHFYVEGKWVMLDGWGNGNVYYTQRMTQEQMCDASCNNCQTISTGGAQHYALWEVPKTAYCLKADGVITEHPSGLNFRFGHTQVYFPPAPCSNTWITGRMCIRQWESWWDANGTPYQRKLERDQYLAKGLGNGFIIQTYYNHDTGGPTNWRAEGRWYWDY